MKRYPGIRPFTSDDRHLFYGRDQENSRLFQLVVLNDIVVLFGKSGIGKSSLLQAGVCPQLEDHHLHPVFIRLNDTTSRPEQQVYQYLKEQEYIPRETPAGLSLWEYFKAFWYADLGEVFTPVVIFDQFEELFTLYTPEERQVFINEFADIVNGRMPASLRKHLKDTSSKLDANIDWETSPKVKFVLSIRSDYLYLLDELSADIPAILRTRFQLNRLNRTNAIQAITLPALSGGNFTSPVFEYQADALDEIIKELGKKESDQLRSDLPNPAPEIEAFQLQLFCQQIENKIIREKQPENFIVTSPFYEGRNGIQKIIGEFYTQVISRVPKKWQDKVEALAAKALIRNKRRIIMEETAIIEESEVPLEILDQLHEERLLRKEARTGNFYYEISHDTLIDPVLEKYKLIEEREQLKRLELERIEKEKELVEERKKRQRATLFGALGTFLAVVAIGASFIAFRQSEKAQAAQLDAEEKERTAIAAQAKAEEAKKAAEESLNKFLEEEQQRKRLEVNKLLETARTYYDAGYRSDVKATLDKILEIDTSAENKAKVDQLLQQWKLE